MHRFLMFEFMPILDAKAYAKKPRLGRAAKPFYNDETRRPKKKARTEEPPQTETASDAGQFSHPKSLYTSNIQLWIHLK